MWVRLHGRKINDATTGGNFGCRATEGTFNPATYPNFTNLIYAYSHGSGDGQAVQLRAEHFCDLVVNLKTQSRKIQPRKINDMHSLYKSFFIISVLCGTLWSPVMKAQVYPAGFAQQGVGGGLAVQTATAFAPDGRIFVAEQTGRIRIIKNGATVATPFATLAVDATGERGLLGIAVDPDFLTNKFIYVYHTVPAAGGAAPYNRVIKLNATNDVVSGAPVVLLNLEPLGANIHNAGAMHFGTDKKLYIAVGENAKPSTAQDLTNYGGKLLRINTDGSAAAGNPFISNTNEKAKRVWALGLRNPFTFAIDKETGKIFVNDVGQALWEEINDATVGGRNFGWPSTEGKFTQASFPNFTNPVYAYGHPPNGGTTYSDGIGCAIVGGAFISPSNTNYPRSIGVNIFTRIIVATGSICWIFRPVPPSVLLSQRR